ncbi:MAG: PIN domain-containing protein [Bacteroidota bacterium]
MDYLLDTNIVLAYIRQDKRVQLVDERYDPLSESNAAIISIVTVGEIKSIAIRNNWGDRKLELLETLLNQFIVADINVKSVVERYAQIDAFSQGRLKDEKSTFTARNMGKNDLWIAATASVLDVPLITTDRDFAHLNTKFLKLEEVKLI